MTPKRWQEIEQIFQAALERAPGDRAAFLDEACADDAALRREVESLIASYQKAGSFIEPPAPQITEGECIGPYRIIREIGRGGMGAVYLAARDDEYRRQVALKLIKRGMDTDFIIRRFRNERQMLAALNHPNIARLLDGGTTQDGLPYFVMEHIEGQPLDRYSDDLGLDIAARLRLFGQACAAVQYAHQNLIIHRDLKPSNILVTADGVPKLLDFGIAKLLNPDLAAQTLDQTATAVRMMTPDYASPEQARGEPVTTASDVYSLGVVLYELLTGHRPYHFKNYQPQEIARVICEEEPEKPSTAATRDAATTEVGAGTTRPGEAGSRQREKLRRRLAGDLDNIVMKALHKEPQRRYLSVEQFSEDIRRHLEGLPVLARKDTLAYRAGKFIRRHRVGVAAAALIALTLIAGIAVTLWQARQVSMQRARAERRFNDVRRLANSFMFEFHDEIENLPGSTPARELVVRRALEYLNSLAQEAGDDRVLRLELAMAYEKIGNLQGMPHDANLGDTAGAMESYRKALVIREGVAAANPTNAQARRDLAYSYHKMGDILAATGDTAGALEQQRQALEIRQALSATNPADAEARRDLMISYQRVGTLLAQAGDVAGALSSQRQALEIREALTAADPTNLSYRNELASGYMDVGDALLATDDLAGALDSYRKGLPISEALTAQNPTNARFRRKAALIYDRIGYVMKATGDPSGAVEQFRKVLAIYEELAKADPGNADARIDLASGYFNIGEAYAQSGDIIGALASYRKAAAIFESAVKADPKNVEVQNYLAMTFANIGEAFAQAGNVAGALDHHRKALAISAPLAESDPANAQFRAGLAERYAALGGVFATLASDARTPAARRSGHWREARSWYQRSLDVWRDLGGKGGSTGSFAGKAEKVAKEIARCDEALTTAKSEK